MNGPGWVDAAGGDPGEARLGFCADEAGVVVVLPLEDAEVLDGESVYWKRRWQIACAKVWSNAAEELQLGLIATARS